MPNYLVRTIGDHEAVGIFAVEDLVDLAFWVDEATDLDVCEYAEIGSGSIYWPDDAMTLPARDHDWDREPRAIVEAIGHSDLGGTWFGALISENLVWQPFVLEGSAANDP